MTLTEKEKQTLQLYFDWATINISAFTKATSPKIAMDLMQVMSKFS